MKTFPAFMAVLVAIFALPAAASAETSIVSPVLEIQMIEDGASEFEDTSVYRAGGAQYTAAGWEWAVNTYGRAFWAYECRNITFSYGPTSLGTPAEASRSSCHIRANLPMMNGQTSYAVVGLAVHETGHLAGCPHSANTNSVMTPWVATRHGQGVMQWVNSGYPPVNCY